MNKLIWPSRMSKRSFFPRTYQAFEQAQCVKMLKQAQ